jgi:hypothetical protein
MSGGATLPATAVIAGTGVVMKPKKLVIVGPHNDD